MRLSDFDYTLPPELIAQQPLADRTASRMLVLQRQTGACELRVFRDFVSFLRPGDCLVLNDTRVIPARLLGRRAGSGGAVEVLLVHALDTPAGHWKAMLRPGRRLNPGARLELGPPTDAVVTVEVRRGDGTFRVSFSEPDVLALAQRAGRVPLPPYIARQPETTDTERYQTVYAATPGAVAAPTAGLHFTRDTLAAADRAGATLARVTLHVGPGTFLPVKTDDLEQHVMHAEYYELTAEAAATVNAAKAGGGRIIAIGTTSVRVLETCVADDSGRVLPSAGWTRLFLYPPMCPKVTDGLLTNFHLPCSSLLMLVSTFAPGTCAPCLRAGNRERFRFFVTATACCQPADPANR
jgi:S-adenosylmethionine:tRNA ribosyltransferase-isomerase